MDFKEILDHHIPDHVLKPLFSVGAVRFSLTKHLVVMWCVGAVLLLTFSFAVRSRSRAGLLLRTVLEGAVLYFRDTLLGPVLGHETKRYLSYFLTLFFFILGCNLAGLIPGSATATGNVSVTAALSLCTLFLIVFAGIRANGLGPFLAHFWPVPPGLPWWVLPFMVFMPVIEVAGLFVRCIALTIRLFANMIAGHIVALGFLALIFILGAASHAAGWLVSPVSVALVVFVYLIELLVAVLQAYIFTLLTAVFVGGFVQHGH